MKAKRRVKDNPERARMLIRLGRLLMQGYTTDAALSFLRVHVSPEIKQGLAEMQKDLRLGKRVHEGLEHLHLPAEILSFVYFYEEQGNVAGGLIQAGALFEKREQTKKNIQKLMRYPVLLIWVSLLVIIVLNQFIVPHFQALFSTMNSEPPFLTGLFLDGMSYFPYVAFALLLLGALVFLYVQRRMKPRSPHEKVAFLLAFKPTHHLTKRLLTYYFSLQFGRLLDAGMSMQQALHVFEKQNHLKFFSDEATRLKIDLSKGEPFHELLEKKSYFLTELSFVVENGTRTGYLAADMQHYSELLYQELDEGLQKGLTWLQPVFLILIGGFVFGLFLAVMLPMFEMIGALD
ncbi:competence type IV pilus assembly protein ComGB [Shouchella shacheensis]|uniref:competence type IV pilus assembly protein ComGB n=1 Tax=Shouchella shacheensis TaxID=1649580 RepID=UPI0007402B6A|nr:competence type IV pilus assembly protein ComGB [Shouchella shacheensis]